MNGSTEKIWEIVNKTERTVAVLASRIESILDHIEGQSNKQQSRDVCTERWRTIHKRIDGVEIIAKEAVVAARNIKDCQHADTKKFAWVIITRVITAGITLLFAALAMAGKIKI